MIGEMLKNTQMKKLILLILINISLLSCNRNVVFTEFQSLLAVGWEADSVLVYSPQIDDTTSTYELQIIVRHTDKYPYQNLWLFVDVAKDSTILRRDTIESFLADDRGQWLGHGMRIYELPLLYLEKLPLVQSGDYEVIVQQGMREDTLRGIVDVGLKIIKN